MLVPDLRPGVNGQDIRRKGLVCSQDKLQEAFPTLVAQERNRRTTGTCRAGPTVKAFAHEYGRCGRVECGDSTVVRHESIIGQLEGAVPGEDPKRRKGIAGSAGSGRTRPMPDEVDGEDG